MKKILLIFVLFCTAFFSKAQTQKAQTFLWANIGGSYSSLYLNSENTSSTKGVIGPELGLSIRMESPTYWGFEAGGYYTTRGVDFSDSNRKVNINYVGIFLNGLLFFPLENEDNAYVGAGFYVANAIDGEIKTDTTASKITFGDTWKNLDAGIQLRAAYTIKNAVAFGLHYDIGVLRTYSSTDLRGEALSGRNSAFTVFASIRLARLSKK